MAAANMHLFIYSMQRIRTHALLASKEALGVLVRHHLLDTYHTWYTNTLYLELLFLQGKHINLLW